MSEEVIEALPQDTVEAACSKTTHNTVRFLGLIEFERENLPLRSIETTLKKSIGKDHWLIGTHFCENWDIIAQAIRDGKGISVSDGSFCPERLRGTAALRIWHEDTMEKFQAVNRTPGSKEEQNSYRSELR